MKFIIVYMREKARTQISTSRNKKIGRSNMDYIDERERHVHDRYTKEGMDKETCIHPQTKGQRAKYAEYQSQPPLFIKMYPNATLDATDHCKTSVIHMKTRMNIN